MYPSHGFSISRQILEHHRTDLDKNSESLFYEVCHKAKAYVENVIDQKISEQRTGSDYVEIHDKSIKGDSLAVKMMKDMIDDFINQYSYTMIGYPEPYTSLTEAIFHENYGWGPLVAFKRGNYIAAKVIGTDIWFKDEKGWQQQPYSFRHQHDVKALTERFKLLNKDNKLDHHTNQIMETVSIDGIRISVIIPSLSYEPSITLRNQVVRTYSFEHQAKLGTIPQESVELFKILAKLEAKGMIAGPPGVGKSTFLLTMLSLSKDMQTAYIEPVYELYPRALFPNSPIQHIVAKGEELEERVFPALLRHDIEQIIMAEVRRDEVEFFGSSGERGIKKLLGTFHNEDPENLPGILARLSVQHRSVGYNYADEYLRFAENLHFSITMDEDEYGRKLVTGLQFYDVNKYTLEVKVMKVLNYNWTTEKWEYFDELPSRIEKMLLKQNRKDYERFKNILKQLTVQSPMAKEERVIVGLAKGEIQ